MVDDNDLADVPAWMSDLDGSLFSGGKERVITVKPGKIMLSTFEKYYSSILSQSIPSFTAVLRNMSLLARGLP